jgi:CheY-like chemotaxis protein
MEPARQACGEDGETGAIKRRVRTLAHGINNEITPLVLEIEVALAGLREGSEDRAALEAVGRAVDEIAAAVARLQDLPLRERAAAAPAPRRNQAAALNVLIVDDDTSILDSMHAVLTLEGHTVSLAESREAARAAMAKAEAIGKGIDVVITDLAIPGSDGREIARMVKAARAATQVVLLSGWGRGTESALAEPAIDFVLTKPPQLTDLQDTLACCASRIKWDAEADRGAASGSAA